MTIRLKAVICGVLAMLLTIVLLLFLWLKWVGPTWAAEARVVEFSQKIEEQKTGEVVVSSILSLTPSVLTPTPSLLTPTSSPTPTPIIKTDFLLKVPSINLELLVHHVLPEEETQNRFDFGVSKVILDKYNVVDYPYLAYPGEDGIVAIAGHRDIGGSPFWRIEDIEIGDQIVIQTDKGQEFFYTVYRVEVAEPNSEIFWETESSQELRLVSCRIADISVRVYVFAGLEERR